MITVGISELEAYQPPSQIIKTINSTYDPVVTRFLQGPDPIACQSHIMFDQVKITLNQLGKNHDAVEFIKGIQERFEL